jgi:hypothetical protein
MRMANTNSLRKQIFEQIEKTLESSKNDLKLTDILESQRFKQVLLELRDVGFSNVSDCDENLSKVTLVHHLNAFESDISASESVYLNVTLPANFPQEGPICNDEFPTSFSLKKYVWIPNKSKLCHIYSTFVDRAKSLEPVSIDPRLSYLI